MSVGSTAYCVYCLKRKAVEWGGHVLKGSAVYLAGWCERHKERGPKIETDGGVPVVTGFVGHYVGSMGERQKRTPRKSAR